MSNTWRYAAVCRDGTWCLVARNGSTVRRCVNQTPEGASREADNEGLCEDAARASRVAYGRMIGQPDGAVYDL